MYQHHIMNPFSAYIQQQPEMCTVRLQGKNVSKLTTEDVSRLGLLLCELSPSHLRLMAPDVLNSTLLAMAYCKFIPQNQRAELVYLVKETFG